MAGHERGPQALLLVGLVGAGLAISLTVHDAKTAVGLALLGVPVGAWFVVYDRVMCHNEPTPWSLVGGGAGLGASALPALAALGHTLGQVFWLAVVVAGVAWSVLNSISSADNRPRRTAGG